MKPYSVYTLLERDQFVGVLTLKLLSGLCSKPNKKKEYLTLQSSIVVFQEVISVRKSKNALEETTSQINILCCDRHSKRRPVDLLRNRGAHVQDLIIPGAY